MKFAKLYQQTLEAEGIPKDWVESGIQYKALKKCINRVVEELREVGLERETLQALLEYQAESSTENGTELAASSPAIPSRIANADKSRRLSSPSLISYKFDGDTKNFSPKIVVAVETSSNTPVDACLSSLTIQSLRDMGRKRRESDANSVFTESNDTNETGTIEVDPTDAVSIISGIIPLTHPKLPVIEEDEIMENVIIDDDLSLNHTSAKVSSMRDSLMFDIEIEDDFEDDRVPLLNHEEDENEPFPLARAGSIGSETSIRIVPIPQKILDNALSPAPTNGSNSSSASLHTEGTSSSEESVSHKRHAEFIEDEEHRNVRLIEIHLESDSVFFHMLMSELQNLDKFNRKQEHQLTQQIDILRNIIATLVNPNSRKTDMYIWREVFKEYMSSNVFFATLESDHGEHDVDTARRKLIHFASRILGFNNTSQLMDTLGFQPEASNSSSGQGSAPPANGNSAGGHAQSTLLPYNVGRNGQGLSSSKNIVPNSKELLELEHASTAHIESVLEKFFNNAGTLSFGSTPNKGMSTLLTKLKQHNASVNNNNLIGQFKNKESYDSFRQFWTLNTALLRVLQFQSMNRMAISKILKKFDKQTALDARVRFPGFLGIDTSSSPNALQTQIVKNGTPFLSHSLAKNICFVISERLLPITPQIDDFLCPVCLSVAWKPIRLHCGHVFCVKCMIHLQRSKDDKCPMCRKNVVLKADSLNLDLAHMEFLKLYFPKETKEKQQEMEKQIMEEQMEHLKRSGDCIIM